MKHKIIYLFTDSFPYGKGEQFLETEIKELSKYHDRIILVPKDIGDVQRALPDNVSTDVSYAVLLRKKKTLLSVLLVRETLLLCLKILISGSFASKERIEVLKYLYKALVCKTWLAGKATQGNTAYLLYTYWFDYATLGGCLSKKSLKNISVITRAHGYDLYEERNYIGNRILREYQLDLLDRLYAVSEVGADYLKSKYKAYAHKISVARLGVCNPGFVAKPSPENHLHVVSCSFVVDVKRVDFINKVMQQLAASNPSHSIRWTHIGDGPKLAEIKQEIVPQSNFTPVFLGAVTNKDVLEYYKTQEIDLFINLSTSEGIPVSIMEAQSCGIPVMATNVGGTSEIVNDSNGFLLHKDITVDEAVNVLKKALDKQTLKLKAVNSKENWRSKYDAINNYNKFYNKIVLC